MDITLWAVLKLLYSWCHERRLAPLDDNIFLILCIFYTSFVVYISTLFGCFNHHLWISTFVFTVHACMHDINSDWCNWVYPVSLSLCEKYFIIIILLLWLLPRFQSHKVVLSASTCYSEGHLGLHKNIKVEPRDFLIVIIDNFNSTTPVTMTRTISSCESSCMLS